MAVDLSEGIQGYSGLMAKPDAEIQRFFNRRMTKLMDRLIGRTAKLRNEERQSTGLKQH